MSRRVKFNERRIVMDKELPSMLVYANYFYFHK